MWILLVILAAPIAFIMSLAFVAVAGDTINSIISSLVIGIKFSAYACLIIFFLFILLGLILLIHILYRNCETKGEKIFLSFTLSGLLIVLVYMVSCKLKTTNITVVNNSKNDIITEIQLVTIENESFSYKPNPKETKVFDYENVDYKIRFTEEMTERCKKLGFNYKKGQEWYSLNSNQKCMVSGLWQSESYTFRVPKGTWIIILKTINCSTENFYYVIYDKNAFCTHIGESLCFSYSGEDISLTEHRKAPFMPEIIDKYLEKEVSKKFEPNLIIITKESGLYSNSGLIIKNKSQSFPDIKKGKYEFKCLLPNTYTVEIYFSEFKDNHYEKVFREEREITINKNCFIFYLDEGKKTIKQIDSSMNYKRFKLDN